MTCRKPNPSPSPIVSRHTSLLGALLLAAPAPALGASHLDTPERSVEAAPRADAVSQLLVSTGARRDLAAPLEGASVGGRVYVFVEAPGASLVRFITDGTRVDEDYAAPFDLLGTLADGSATPLNTDLLSQGVHHVAAEVVIAGQTTALQATFTVDSPTTGPAGQLRSYADTAWASLHRDARNSDCSPLVGPLGLRPRWTALQGHALMTAPTLGPDGTIYVTAAREAGYSNLYALTPDGDIRWASEPVMTYEQLDSEAGSSSPVIDRDGDVYLADRNQLWAWHADGTLKWVSNTEGSFITAVLTADGDVSGISGDGEVHLFDGQTGALLAPVMNLPGGDGPEAPPAPAGLWLGMMDPAVIQQNWGGILGLDSEVVNTPALDPHLNRLFTVGAGQTPDQGVFYGIDLTPGGLTLAFATPMGPGSGTSPAISPDFSQVYASDGDGVLYAFDGQTGEVIWAKPLGESLGSPSVGLDGTLYTLADGQLAALTPQGDVLWSAQFNAVAEAELPDLPSPDGPIAPVARVDTVITVTPRHIYLAVVMGYPIEPEGTGDRFLLVKDVRLLVIDPADGGVLRQDTQLIDSSENVVVPSPTGDVYVGYLSMFSSITYNSINASLPRPLQVGPPVGGIQAFSPRDLRELATDQIGWAKEVGAQALSLTALGMDLETAHTLAGQSLAQIGPIPQVLTRANAQHQLGPRATNKAIAAAEKALTATDDAYNRLATARLQAQPDPRLLDTIQALLDEAQAQLTVAASQL